MRLFETSKKLFYNNDTFIETILSYDITKLPCTKLIIIKNKMLSLCLFLRCTKCYSSKKAITFFVASLFGERHMFRMLQKFKCRF